MADEISAERKNYAKVLSSLIIEKLEKLELPKVKFDISFEKTELTINGCDKVEFLISTKLPILTWFPTLQFPLICDIGPI